MKKLIALLLVLLTVLPMAIACAETNTPSETTAAVVTDDPSSSNTAEPEETDHKSATLPDNLNFNGENVVILSQNSEFVNDEVSVKETTGAIVNDAIYKRTARVNKRLGITIENQQLNGGVYAVSDELRTAASSGETYFDITVNSTYSTILYTSENVFVDLTECEYLDLSAPYWSQGFNEAASIGNSQYLCTGAASLSLYRYMWVTFYNKKLLSDANHASLYEVVDQGKWTIDYLTTLSKDLYNDTDGNGSIDASDTIGFLGGQCHHIDPFLSSCNIKFISKDADNIPEYSLDVERMSTMVDKLINLYHGARTLPISDAPADGGQAEMSEIFCGGRAATTIMRLASVETETFLNMKDEYGIIPVPKLDESQEKHHTFIHDQFTSWGICSVHMKDEEKVQMLGAVLECMALENYNEVIPAYYELALKGRYLEDSESWRMLDDIYENVLFDVGVLYTKSLDNIHMMPRDMVLNGRNTVTSSYKMMQGSIKRKLDKLVDDILALD